MLFNSFHFLIFFPIVFLLYLLLPPKKRWVLLLIASYYFYLSWEPVYLLLIVFSTGVDYFTGQKMGALETKKSRRPYLLLSLFSNLGLLFAFKYFNFFNSQASLLAEHLEITYSISSLDVLLPVGISFYTFQTLSYSIDIYKGIIKPEKHLGKFALFVSFFPQLVAGPIERAKHLIPQLSNKLQTNYINIVEGLRLILWGMFKKVVVADRLAIYVDVVYNNPHAHAGSSLILATYLFAFQIYCDFSGYSDIAIGLGRMMGVDIMTNFKRPLFFFVGFRVLETMAHLPIHLVP